VRCLIEPNQFVRKETRCGQKHHLCTCCLYITKKIINKLTLISLINAFKYNLDPSILTKLNFRFQIFTRILVQFWQKIRMIYLSPAIFYYMTSSLIICQYCGTAELRISAWNGAAFAKSSSATMRSRSFFEIRRSRKGCWRSYVEQWRWKSCCTTSLLHH